MAQIYSGDRAGMRALMYGEGNRDAEDYFRENINRGMDRLNATSRRFVESTKEFGFLATETVKRAVRRARQRVTWAVSGNYVKELESLNDFRYAMPRMIDYVMAEPNTRRAFHSGRLAGYDDDYIDEQPGVVGDRHRAYRRVMDGIIVANEDAESDVDFEVTHYIDDIDRDAPELEFDEQVAILRSWDRQVARLTAGGKDFTSLYNASLD